MMLYNNIAFREYLTVENSETRPCAPIEKRSFQNGDSDSDSSEFEGFLEDDIVCIERNIDADESDIDFSSGYDDSESDDSETGEESDEGNDKKIGKEDKQDGGRDEEHG